jgi:hypothetical protein
MEQFEQTLGGFFFDLAQTFCRTMAYFGAGPSAAMTQIEQIEGSEATPNAPMAMAT